MIKVGINGFGSIGRRFLRASKRAKNYEVVALNDLADPSNLAYLLKYDSNYGTLDEDVTVQGQGLIVGGKYIHV
ncbi:MAG TPA: glyceraldehyde 3-phosphate dehydrogenase NAD-binding domain-containing protein, partial [Bacillota bacterium]|nr:glyceraldehyde 3-phosphate dehydrogenase NAD-binding domain-containing protein [Bacillota bacterium]